MTTPSTHPSTSPLLDYTPGPCAFRPSPEVTDHFGQPLSPNLDFFFPPPADIGPLISAWSAVREGKILYPLYLKIILACLATLLATILACMLTSSAGGDAVGVELVGMATFLGGLFAFLGFALRKRSISYVGRDGIALISTRNGRYQAKSQLVRFCDTFTLFTAQTRQYYNGIYTGTYFNYRFHDFAGRSILKLKGSYYSSKGRPKPNSLFNLALASEFAWTDHLINRLNAELKSTGRITFPINANDAVAILPGGIELTFKGQTTALTPPDIKSLGLNSGTFHIHTHQARWFSGKGKFSFQYAQMPNARAFILCMEQLAGYRFS